MLTGPTVTEAFKHMPLELLRAFIKVAEQHSITRASVALGLSQPTVSLQIKRLERLVDATLFQRRGQRFDLTPSGEDLMGYAERMLDLNEEVFAHFSGPTLSGRLRFGIPSEFATTVLPKIIGRFAKRHPSVALEVVTDLSRRLVQRFNQRELDVILTLGDHPGVEIGQLLRNDELVWVGGRQWRPVEGEEPVALVLAPEGCIYRQRIVQEMKRQRRRYAIVYTALDLASIETAIVENLGITALAKSAVPPSVKVIKPQRNLPELGKIAIGVLSQSGTDSEAQRRLVQYVSTSL